MPHDHSIKDRGLAIGELQRLLQAWLPGQVGKEQIAALDSLPFYAQEGAWRFHLSDLWSILASHTEMPGRQEPPAFLQDLTASVEILTSHRTRLTLDYYGLDLPLSASLSCHTERGQLCRKTPLAFAANYAIGQNDLELEGSANLFRKRNFLRASGRYKTHNASAIGTLYHLNSKDYIELLIFLLMNFWYTGETAGLLEKALSPLQIELQMGTVPLLLKGDRLQQWLSALLRSSYPSGPGEAVSQDI